MKIIIAFATVCVISVVTSSAVEDVQSEVDSQDAQIDSRASRQFWSHHPRPGGWLRRTVDNDQEADAVAPISENEAESVLPEMDNYDQDGIEEDPCYCGGWFCCIWHRRRRRSVTEDGNPITVLGSKTELKLYKSKEDLDVLYNTPVIRAELYERQLNSGTDRSISLALGGRQYGVVVSLNDGRRFLVIKGNQMGRGSKTVAIISNHMTDDWTKVDTKVISSSTLGDFIKAGGDRFDAFKDNGRQAALRMMALQ